MPRQTYTHDQVLLASTDFFRGDRMVADNFASKYALRDGDAYYELTPADLTERLAKEFYRIECKYPNPVSLDRIRKALEGFKGIIAQGSPMSGIGNDIDIVSLSNCVVIASPKDSISGIHESGRDAANLFKRRCGVGVDISTLRPDGAKVRNSAKTSIGAWGYADFFSYVCRKTGQNGRRGALMVSMHIWHPDIEKFITMKGLTDKHHEKYLVTGANISVQINDEFMAAVETDADWDLVFEGVKYATVKATHLWDLICTCATNDAEPGIIFEDNYHRNMPLSFYPGYRMICVNPCGEIGLSAYDSCRLMIINFLGYVVDAYLSPLQMFDWEAFRRDVRLLMRLMDDLVDLEIECLERIIAATDDEDEGILFEKLKKAAIEGRRTGLGTTGIADALAALGVKYDDPLSGRAWLKELFKTLRDEAYRESVTLAKERGAFPIWDWEIEKECEFFGRDFPEDILADMKIHGRRNGTILTQAPTGTTSMMASSALGRRNVSAGCEPAFALSYDRWKKLTPNDELHLSIDRTDAQGDNWHKYTIYHSAVLDYYEANGLPEGSPLPGYFVTADSIDWVERIRIQGVMQSYIDHGISSTINLPKGTTVDTVKTLYQEAHRAGLKGVTVYVDGSRDAVLVRTTDVATTSERPDDLACEIHHEKVRSTETTNYTIFVGIHNGKPFEVFGGLAAELPAVGHSYETGNIRRIRLAEDKSRYELLTGDKKIANLGTAFRSGDHAVINRLVSRMLRDGVSVEVIVDQLTKEKSGNLLAYNRVLSRVLKKHIRDGVESSNRCPNCEAKTLRFEEGCHKCDSCGYTGCG